MNQFEKSASKLKVMGHPVRLQILDMLRRGETCVCHIEQALDKRQSYISQQLMALRDAGLVNFRKEGLQVYYRLSDDPIKALLDLILGKLDVEELEVLDDCSCPACSVLLITDIK